MAEGSMMELDKLSPTAQRKGTQNTSNRVSSIAVEQKWQLLLEPALVGAMIAINLGQTTLQNFYLRTACSVDLGHPSETCDGSVNITLETEKQAVVAGVNVSRSFVGSLISTIVLLFVGPWSDCSGRRKPLLVMPLAGMCIMSIGVLLMLTFPGASTVQVLYAVQIPISLGGNFGLLLAAAFCHIGDVCHASGRDVTRTMGTHRAAIQVAHVVGAVGGPLLFRQFGYYGVFPIVLLLQASSLIYVVYMVKDVKVNDENKVSVFNLTLPFKAIYCLFKPREGHRRAIILLMLVVAMGDKMILSAEVLNAYMYFRKKYEWTDVLFGSYLAYKNIISFFGTLLILTILKRRLKLSDEMVGVASCASYVASSAGLFVASSTYFVFLIPLFGIIAQGSQVVQRPIINKQISPNEQATHDLFVDHGFPPKIIFVYICHSLSVALAAGVHSSILSYIVLAVTRGFAPVDIESKIYSVLGALESATQTFSSPLYSLIYMRTVATFPDAWLIPGLLLALVQATAYSVTRIFATTKDRQNVAEEKSEPFMKT